MQSEVESALELLLDAGKGVESRMVRELVEPRTKATVPKVKPHIVDLKSYDALLGRNEVAS
jgi:hypothetical protein